MKRHRDALRLLVLALMSIEPDAADRDGPGAVCGVPLVPTLLATGLFRAITVVQITGTVL